MGGEINARSTYTSTYTPTYTFYLELGFGGTYMDVKTLGKITKWMESTDLEEITWKNGEDKISLKVNNFPESHSKFSATLEPVAAPSIGFFRFARPGKTNTVN